MNYRLFNIEGTELSSPKNEIIHSASVIHLQHGLFLPTKAIKNIQILIIRITYATTSDRETF